jgi:hypothetical protein
MEITDLNGNSIEVTDLETAIKLAGQYKCFEHEDKSYSDFDNRQKAYWKDIYEKLLLEKDRLSNTKNK